MKAMCVVFFVLLLASCSHAQQRWERTYGGAGYDQGFSVQQTSDGGYIVAGTTSSFGNGYQVYLVKTNSSGDTLWTRTCRDTGDDYGSSVQQTSDGGYIVAGTVYFSGNPYRVFLVKANASGDTLWTRTYGGNGGFSFNLGFSVQQTTGGGYIVAGTTAWAGNNGLVYLIKTNATGDTTWTRTYGGGGSNVGNSVQQTTDGGYIVAGTTGNIAQVYLIRTNASGDTLWTRTYGGTGYDFGYSVQQTTDGGYIVAGIYDYYGSNPQCYLVKTNATGDTLWTRTYGGTGADWGYTVQQTSDTGYIVAGTTSSFGDSFQVYLVKTNATGDTLWTRTFGDTNTEYGYSVRQTSDGGYIIAGWTNSFGAGGEDVYLIKTDANGNVGVEDKPGSSRQETVGRITAQPNPFMSFARVPGHEGEKFKLYDVMGRMVGTYKGDRIGERLAAGVYFLRSSDNKDKPLRIVKVR